MSEDSQLVRAVADVTHPFQPGGKKSSTTLLEVRAVLHRPLPRKRHGEVSMIIDEFAYIWVHLYIQLMRLLLWRHSSGTDIGKAACSVAMLLLLPRIISPATF